MVGSEMDGSTKTLKFISAAVYEINSSVQHTTNKTFLILITSHKRHQHNHWLLQFQALKFMSATVYQINRKLTFKQTEFFYSDKAMSQIASM